MFYDTIHFCRQIPVCLHVLHYVKIVIGSNQKILLSIFDISRLFPFFNFLLVIMKRRTLTFHCGECELHFKVGCICNLDSRQRKQKMGAIIAIAAKVRVCVLACLKDLR